ncbi:MAG: guanylate kinase [Candidatus Izemoplasmatales bacterium]|jgi:guanylate kinase|nr:guanylate kinase [Candidatus Izemoplasmatales bacterium]NLF48648.1 guanylate kinase [Acholeplasmataceae bacterium]MDD4354443.1 guanylate kinase [Candidatus Izemoplasmatales bacterium]MDD4987723.1 guanylate kinase [Candidatus Izemoplasmatales bacterium]MDD5601481.1 guanylate kinase [Candidatus Izemoplasmatales bacterium]
MKLNERGLLVVISGPSGVGKGTIRKALFEMPDNNFCYSVSMTTRKPREGEKDGVDYFFVSREEFEKKIQENKFLEFAEFVGEYYGTPVDYIEKQLTSGKEVIMEIEVQGALQVQEKMPDAVFIFIVPPSKQVLYDRLIKRGTEQVKDVEKRIQKAEREYGLAYKYDYIVVNDDIENAADRIYAIIRAEHAKTERSIHKYHKLMGVK